MPPPARSSAPCADFADAARDYCRFVEAMDKLPMATRMDGVARRLAQVYALGFGLLDEVAREAEQAEIVDAEVVADGEGTVTGRATDTGRATVTVTVTSTITHTGTNMATVSDTATATASDTGTNTATVTATATATATNSAADPDDDERYDALVKAQCARIVVNLAIDLYHVLLDPLDLGADDNLGTGDICDDILDIWADLQRGLLAYDAGDPIDAAWYWRLMYTHWSNHAVNALQALRAASER